MKSKRKRTTHLLIGITILLLFLFIGSRTSLEINNYTYTDSQLPESFNHFKIVQLSDFHGAEYKDKQLIHAVQQCSPNVIFLTGDMIDKNHPSWDNLIELLEGLNKIAPIYAISGNHEFDSWSSFQNLLQVYEAYNVIFLDDTLIQFTNTAGDTIEIQGVKYRWNNSVSDFPIANPDRFTILLNHSSQDFAFTKELGYNLVFSGHTHGGIIRLPIIGGVLGNNGDLLFPKYDSGVFTENGTTMYSNRGLGNSVIPRFNNNPEIICVELLSESPAP